MIDTDRSLASLGPSSDHVRLDGAFECREAQELLLQVFDAEINQLKLRSWSSMVNTHQPDQEAERCIEDLRAKRSKLCQALDGGGAAVGRVRVRSRVELAVEPARSVSELRRAGARLA